ncbi:MAG: hypothetical protein LBK45_04050 [Tannerellaceae bacterium]|nr:hypothetical protein [Tannerellaceae bacterium]
MDNPGAQPGVETASSYPQLRSELNSSAVQIEGGRSYPGLRAGVIEL